MADNPEPNIQEQVAAVDPQLAETAFEDKNNVNAQLEQAQDAHDNPWKASVPEKFHRETLEESMAAMAESYKALEKKLSQPATEDPVTPEVTEETSDTPVLDLSKSETASFDWNDLETEILNNGELSADSLQKIQEAFPGLPKEIIDAHVSSLTTQQTQALQLMRQRADQIFTELNVDRQALQDWAVNNLSDEKREQYDAALADPATMEMGLRSLIMEATGGKPQPTGRQMVEPVQAQPTSGGHKPFQTNEEMVIAMQDPRYKNDPEYRREITSRIAASTGVKDRKIIDAATNAANF